jgi:hypothetical protein
MTKGEAWAQFLRYLGAATVNGEERDTADLRDLFNYLLDSAVTQAAAQFPLRQIASVTDEWDAPQEFFELLQAVDSDGAPVSYRMLGERHFLFERPCTVEYAAFPPQIDPLADDSTPLGLDCRAALLIPVRVAIDAAVSLEEFTYRVPYLTATYNGLASSLGDRAAPARRRVYAV